MEGPTRYGYEFVKWSKDLNTIKAELAKGNTTVVVSPVYKEASDTFDIEIVLDDASQGVVKYPINTVVNADASSLDNFAYWEDGDGNKLSYNAKYSFYANKDMVVKAVTSTTAVYVSAKYTGNEIFFSLETTYPCEFSQYAKLSPSAESSNVSPSVFSITFPFFTSESVDSESITVTLYFVSVDEIGAVEGPTRYGYEFVKWSKDLNTIKAELAKGNTTVVVSPVYKEASDTFDIEIVLDDASQGVVKYPINTVVNADASSLDNFAYWEDGDGNKLSYNAKYSFYANKDMVVKAVTSTTAVNSDVIIRTVKAPTIIGNSGDKVAIFEFNVPDGAQIKYAGVVADTDKNNLTLQNAKYKLGNFVNSDILTYKYTLTKRSSMTDTIYVKPVIKYTMNGAEYEKYGTMVEEL